MGYGSLHKEIEDRKKGLNLSAFILGLIKSGSHGKCESTKVCEARGENSKACWFGFFSACLHLQR